MIIWGSTGKEKTIDRPDFYCPECRTDVSGKHIGMYKYFTLYFIPLFSMEKLSEYVQCDQCHETFNTSILDLSADEIEEALQPWKCEACGNANPPGRKRCLGCNEPRG